jgi:membrane protease YdiL (CAAX protease family)
MKLLVEPLIIFIVLFFPGLYFSLVSVTVSVTQFDINQEMMRIITHNIPALCLIWFFLLKEPIRSVLGILKPQKKDFFQALTVILGLLIIGFAVGVMGNLIFQKEIEELAISGFFSWIIIILSCMSTGYMEESYFRVYIINHLTLSGIKQRTILIASSVLFAICHIYEGPAGFITSLLAGMFLSYVYIKRKSIHGIALGHAFYNLTAYLLAHIYSVSGVSM